MNCRRCTYLGAYNVLNIDREGIKSCLVFIYQETRIQASGSMLTSLQERRVKDILITCIDEPKECKGELTTESKILHTHF